MASKIYLVRDKRTKNLIAMINLQSLHEGFELYLYQISSDVFTRHLVESVPDDLARWYEVTILEQKQNA
jgi:hypothetical protein